MSGAGATGASGGRAGRFVALGVLAATYLGLAIAYQRATPIFEAPDEQSHIHYVAFVAREGRLPRSLERPEVPGEGMQPPLYYLLLAPLFRAIDPGDAGLLPLLERASRGAYGQVDAGTVRGGRLALAGPAGKSRYFVSDASFEYLRALRWGSLLFGLLAVVFTFAAALRVSGSTPFAFLSAALLAFSPQFLFVSAYVNNDIACAALGAAALWLFASVAERGRVTRAGYVAAAALVAAGVATKHSSLPALGVCFAALFALDARPLRARLRDAALAAALGVALAAPVWLSNAQRLADVFGVSAELDSARGLLGNESFGGLHVYLAVVYPYTTFLTYWAAFGWASVLAPRSVYALFLALTLTGVAGFFWGWRGDRRALAAPEPDARARAALQRTLALRRYLLASVLATLAAHFWINLHALAAQGRHLFGAAPQVAALLALGLATLGGGRALAPRWIAVAGVTAGMLWLAVFGLRNMLLAVFG